MLRPEFTIDDLTYLITLIVMLVGMYGTYVWGKRDGYYEGCKARRYTNRQIRRIHS